MEVEEEGLRKELERIEQRRLEVAAEWSLVRRRMEGVRRARRGKEERLLGEIWHEYWSKHGTMKLLGYVSGEEKARLGYEEVRRLNRERNKRYRKKEYKCKAETKLSRTYRRRARQVLGSAPLRRRSESLSVLVGCSVAYWRQHLEKQFEEGMSWDNYGRKWDVDHIMPVSSFNLGTLEGARRAFNWMNTRPMWKWENNRKGARITHPQYQLVFGEYGEHIA